MKLRLDDLADVRSGDKGGTLILAVFASVAGAHEVLDRCLSADVVAHHFRAREAVRRAVPQLEAFVFELPGLLGDGVTGSTVLDGHGKTMSYFLAMLDLEVAGCGDGIRDGGGSGE